MNTASVPSLVASQYARAVSRQPETAFGVGAGRGPMRSDAQPRDCCAFQRTIRGYESFVPDAI